MFSPVNDDARSISRPNIVSQKNSPHCRFKDAAQDFENALDLYRTAPMIDYGQLGMKYKLYQVRGSRSSLQVPKIRSSQTKI